MQKESSKLLKNEEIKNAKVMVVDIAGSAIGIYPTKDAIGIAKEEGLDLVLVSPSAVPPVCRIADFGKLKYEEQKKLKTARRQQKNASDVKEIRLTPVIQEADLEVKEKQARKFLVTGNKVKVSMRFRGRECLFPEEGKKVMDRFTEMLQDISSVVSKARSDEKNMDIILVPEKIKKHEKSA